MDIILTPGDGGRHCLGNGTHRDEDGNAIELRCDECDYLICCTNSNGLCDLCFDEHKWCAIGARTEAAE